MTEADYSGSLCAFWNRNAPPRLLAENVPGLLTTCSCPLCAQAHCGKCKAKVDLSKLEPEEREEWVCPKCGSEDLVAAVLPQHRGTDFFVVLSALQRVGYGVQTRILDAQYLGVPQRRRRIFFVGHLGAPCPPEILFEPEGSTGDSAPGGEEGKIAAGELARSLRSVGGGNDFGANKGTLVKEKVASPITASAGHHGHSSPRGDGRDNLVAGTLQSCTEGQGRKTPEVDQLVAPTVTSRQHKGCFTDPGNDGLVTVPQLVEDDSASSTPKLPRLRAGGVRGAVSVARLEPEIVSRDSVPKTAGNKVTDLRAGNPHPGGAIFVPPQVFEQRFARNGRTGKGDGAPSVKEGATYAIANDALERSGEGKGGTAAERSGLGITTDVSPSLKSSHPHAVAAPTVAAPLTAGSNPNSNAAGRRREDDKNLVQQPLFIHTADSGMNQGQVKGNGKADCLSKAQPGAVAIQEDKQNGVKVDSKTGSIRASAPGHQPGGSLVAFHSTGGGAGISDKNLCPPITVGTGKDIPSPPAVAYDVAPPAQTVYENHGQASRIKEVSVAPQLNAQAGTGGNNLPLAQSAMSVRRLTPTECERLQGFADGHTCLCGVRPDCPDRRIPSWLDPSTFKLQGCGHSACGCTCADSPRYKSLGNAVATCAVYWIGRRLAAAMKR